MKNVMKDLISKILIAIGILMSLASNGCDGQNVGPNANQPAAVTSTVSNPNPINSGCAISQLKTNGPSFGAPGNTYYHCHAGSASSPVSDIFIAFYDDGTADYVDPFTGQDLEVQPITTSGCFTNEVSSVSGVDVNDISSMNLDSNGYLINANLYLIEQNVPAATFTYDGGYVCTWASAKM